MGDNLHSRVEDSQHVVCVFVARVPVQRTLLISLVLVGMADKMGFGSFMEKEWMGGTNGAVFCQHVICVFKFSSLLSDILGNGTGEVYHSKVEDHLKC